MESTVATPPRDQELIEIKVEFKHFDAIPPSEDNNSSISDHHYFSSPSTLSSRFQKTIMKEWRILQGNLPDSIYVRVYEQRTDLLRAAIVGPAGTPYHDGLFFFDIQFPSNYPNSPPKVCYRSFGYRLNPNLYANGYVCLSLINTWAGRNKNEKWMPTQSTMLQVLVSIQALVLNAKPYFNEPAYANMSKNSEPWKSRSAQYDENAFILSCKTMLHIINTPPKSFEEFVVQHFRDRADAILTACKAYETGRAKIGEQPSATVGTGIKSLPSWTFKRSMQSVYPNLVNSFAKNNGSPITSEIIIDANNGSPAIHASNGSKSTCLLLFVLVLIFICIIFVSAW